MGIITIILIYLAGIITGYLLMCFTINKVMKTITNQLISNMETAIKYQKDLFKMDDRNIQ